MSNWVRVLRRMGGLATISCVVCVMFSLGAHAQSFSITNLSKSTGGKASFPNMVTDSQGNLNLVWIDGTLGIQFARSTSSSGGTSILAPFPVTVPGSNGQALPVFQPQVAVYPTQENVIEIVWAAFDPASTPTAPLYDVWASRSDNSGLPGSFTTTLTPISTTPTTPTGVLLADTPRMAFDGTGKVDVVWGRHDVWISQAQDGKTFGAPTSLIPVATPPNPPIPPPDTGGPRIAVTADSHIFVVWTDEQGKNQPGTFCSTPPPTTDANGHFTNTVGGNFWINETFPAAVAGGPVNISAANTRNLSNTDWFNGGGILGQPPADARFPNGFYGCSYDNVVPYFDQFGRIELVWSDDKPVEDVLVSGWHGTYPAGSPFAGMTEFSFPINLASLSAASPQVAADKSGNFYYVWSGGPGGGTNSQGIFFTRFDHATDKFANVINLAPSATAPAFPRIAVDSNSNVNITWEQPTASLVNNANPMFNVFFARSTDGGNTFPTVLQVTTNPSTLCFAPAPPPESDGTTAPTTPDFSTCGTVQLGVDANSIPDMAWVNQASASAVANIDFATTAFPTGSLSPSAVSLSPTTTTAAVTITVSQNGFSGPVTFSCFDVDTNSSTLPSWLTCTFSPQSLDTSKSTTDTLTFTRAGTPTTSMFISGPSAHVLPGYGGPMAWSMALAAFCLISITMLAVGRRRELSAAVVMRGFLVMTLTLALAAGMVSCGGSTSSPSTTSTTGTSGSSGSGGTGGTGGGGGGTTVTVHVAVVAKAGSAPATNLGTVTVTAQ
jgi:hypothetical protein